MKVHTSGRTYQSHIFKAFYILYVLTFLGQRTLAVNKPFRCKSTNLTSSHFLFLSYTKPVFPVLTIILGTRYLPSFLQLEACLNYSNYSTLNCFLCIAESFPLNSNKGSDSDLPFADFCFHTYKDLFPLAPHDVFLLLRTLISLILNYFHKSKSCRHK